MANPVPMSKRRVVWRLGLEWRKRPDEAMFDARLSPSENSPALMDTSNAAFS